MIYKLNNNKLKKEMLNFTKTTYGKITFLLSYSFFFILLLLSIIYIYNTYPYYIKEDNIRIYNLVITIILLNLSSFILGSIHYYKELKEYIEKRH